MIRSLKAGPKPTKHADGGGLFILVMPNGKKLWRLTYRYAGKQNLLSGGPYPIVKLADARKWRDEVKGQLLEGRDPSAIRKAEKKALAAKGQDAFEIVAREWLHTRSKVWSERYARITRTRLEQDIFPGLGSVPIGDIDPVMLLTELRKIEQRGSVEMAHRIRNHVGEVFRYGIATQRCRSDPSRDIAPAMMRPAPVKHRARVDARDLPQFFAKLAQDEGMRMSHLALRWTMLTMVRTQETRFATWNEIEGLDGNQPLWRITPDRMKMRSEHLVPLSRQAVALLKEIEAANVFRTAGNARLGKFLFPVATSKSDVISENRMLDILYRMGLRGKATVHGFRGLASTVLNESGEFEPDWIEVQLAHVARGVRAAYNSARYLAHRRIMMQWWADYLERAEKAGLSGNVQAAR
ncbi:tyrosine-type recombinase/integrase [Sphingomonas sp. GlSt437]|uniref:tyrosine-type recombinase/integrase n=1 Tax=Sphingomonas sp. GlSt437 TaxID=3389970 RepID=UPI003A84D19B